MLAIPTTGISRSVNRHNVQLDVLCDWIEASVLFLDDELSTTDCVDALCEGHIYDEQDFAGQMVADGWSELRRRQAWLGTGSPFAISRLRIQRRKEWKDVPGHSLCLILSLRKWFHNWSKQFGKNFNTQGELFELLSKESLEQQFAGWVIYRTGWSQSTPNTIATVVNSVAAQLGEPIGKIERWTKPAAKEAGLDLLCYRPFPDERVGVPVYLMQCASGDWEGKLHTPSLKIWGRIIDFTAQPRKAFATPFAFLAPDFIRTCNLVDGMLMDRYRILAPAREADAWVPGALRARINAWLQPHVNTLPCGD